jgi:hypothetical protein
MIVDAKKPPGKGDGRLKSCTVVLLATREKIAKALSTFKPRIIAFAALDPAALVALSAILFEEAKQ